MKINILTKLKKLPRGQSLVELAISLTVILLLLLGAVETSLALFQYIAIRDAAQEGAVYGSIHPDDLPGIKRRAKETASDSVELISDELDPTNPEKNSVTVKINGDEACQGKSDGKTNTIKVTVTFDHIITFPLIGPIISSELEPKIKLATSTTNTILTPPCAPSSP